MGNTGIQIVGSTMESGDGLTGRRDFLKAAIAAAFAAATPLEALAVTQDESSPAGDELLNEVERRACLYFYEMADPQTGLVLDRAIVEQKYSPGVSSIAATGFGLSALCIADLRGYLDRAAAKARVVQTLDFLSRRSIRQHGFFYHFIDSTTGDRVWKSELSSIDTTWLLCGVLHCRMHWDDAQIRDMANDLLQQADWRWMLNGNQTQTLSHGWTPERGFLPYRWDFYAELLAMYLLAISSESHSIPVSCWDAWKRPMNDFQGIFFIDPSAPLFVHQYSHAWFDFRDRADRYANYFANSQRATQAHRAFCMQLSAKFPWYGPNMWGVTASDSRNGYRVWGFPNGPLDGTLVPCASGGSLGFLPTLCGAVLRNMLDRYGSKVWCRYGFVDAFQPGAEWYSPYVIGIDQGIILLMAENVRSGLVWDAVMASPEAKRSMDAVGLRELKG